jgi:beta-lactamase class A
MLSKIPATIHRRNLVAALSTAVISAGAPRALAAEPELEAYEAASGGRIGVYARNLRTGAVIAWRADQRFVMCSTFKLSLVACVLAHVDRGRERLDASATFGPGDILDYAPVAKANLARGRMTVAEMCEAAVELSDNTCANLLLARVGGPAGLTAFWRSAGDRVSRLDHDEPMLNRTPPGDLHDTTTPRAMAGNLHRLILGDVLSQESRTRLKAWMIDSKTGANRLRAGLPATWTVGDKTGNNGSDAAGDLAVAWPRPDEPIVICAYTRGGRPSSDQIAQVFTAVGRMAGERLA